LHDKSQSETFFRTVFKNKVSAVLFSKNTDEILHNNSIYPLHLLYQAHFKRCSKINLLGNSGKINHIYFEKFRELNLAQRPDCWHHKYMVF